MTDRMTAPDVAETASPEEREDVLDLVRSWLDDWADTFQRDDGIEYLGDFVENVGELLTRIMQTMAKHGLTLELLEGEDSFDTILGSPTIH